MLENQIITSSGFVSGVITAIQEMGEKSDPFLSKCGNNPLFYLYEAVKIKEVLAMLVNRLKYERKRKGLKQCTLASKVDVHPSILSLIENGIWNPAEKLKKKLAVALGCKVRDIFPKTPIVTDITR